MFFWNSLAFSMIQRMLAIWSLVPLPFLKPAWTSRSSWFTYCWSLAWNFEHYFTSVWDECSCVVVWAFFGIAFLWNWNENWPFPVWWPLLSFPNLMTYWVQHLHSIIFQDLDLSLLPLVFSLIHTASRLLNLYSTNGKTPRLIMKSFSMVRDTQRGTQSYTEKRRGR